MEKDFSDLQAHLVRLICAANCLLGSQLLGSPYFHGLYYCAASSTASWFQLAFVC